MDKKGLFCLIMINLVALSGACTAIGRTADSSDGQNNGQSTITQSSEGLQAKDEVSIDPQRMGTLFHGSVADRRAWHSAFWN